MNYRLLPRARGAPLPLSFARACALNPRLYEPSITIIQQRFKYRERRAAARMDGSHLCVSRFEIHTSMTYMTEDRGGTALLPIAAENRRAHARFLRFN